jgi:hypothetical protein
MATLKFKQPNMGTIMNCNSELSAKAITLLAIFGLVVLTGCNPEKANGTFLIVQLENSKNIKQYSVFNPYNGSIEECNASAKEAIAQILSSDPMVVPRDSKVTGWRCSVTPPENDK